MFNFNKSITPTADRTTDPCHDNYAHIPGPDPFPPGSPNHTELLAELDRLEIPERHRHQLAKSADVPTPLLKDRKEEPRHTFDECPRATRRLIANEDSVVAAWLPCNARTCGYCREAIDERDAARVAYSLRGADLIYLAEIPTEHWERTRKRAQRAGAVAVKMATPNAHNRIAVISSESVTNQARTASMGEVVKVIENRPAWSPGRAKTSGPGLVSVPEWDRIVTQREAKPPAEKEAETMAPSVTVELLTIAASALKIPYKIENAGTVRLAAHWDDSRMIALRAWTKDPDGSLQWSKMLHETEIATGIGPPAEDEVPAEVYDRQSALEVA